MSFISSCLTRISLRQSFVFALAISASSWSFAGNQDDLRKLVEANQFDAAYNMAQSMPEQVGNPHFDFLLGLSAIGIGKAAEGVLALERHLASVPANDRARLELARGYFLLGEYGLARQEFEFVLKHNPPKEVQDNVQQYLSAMQTRDAGDMRAKKQFYVDLGIGHDSNVNSGTYNKTIQLPTGNVPIANASSLARSDSFMQATTGGQFIKRVSPQFAVFAGGDLDARKNNTANQFDLSSIGGYTGFSYLTGAGHYRVSVAGNDMSVNHQRFRDMFTVTGEAQYTLAQGRTLSGFLQYGDISYTGSNSALDAKLGTLGCSINQAFGGTFRPSLGARLSTTQERNIRLREDLNRDIYMAQLFAGASPSEKLGINASLSWQKQSFHKADLAFATERQDEMRAFDLSANYAITRQWSVRGEYNQSENSSNQNLYDYKRRATAVKMRYEF